MLRGGDGLPVGTLAAHLTFSMILTSTTAAAGFMFPRDCFQRVHIKNHMWIPRDPPPNASHDTVQHATSI